MFFVNLRRILFFEAVTIHSIYLILYCYMAVNIFSFINYCLDQQKLVIDFLTYC
jgi:heme/copper-type cytochrome/quinol oxidase subunit 1